ncbi:cation-translocating P-type ATPase [Adhaeribacter soli]|uniref:Cation-transporting P-type ATPase n=1 Tax=Adhaeribacter soli TaxID=2607655 RepID=A0A5N1IRZ3_9BACT|nr:cation-transporting P-type ATPase [Adhaeribacter soli]KAA9332757.1 cation-transporting P-type ATPase [Adhaeribacter soli]
MEPLQLTGLSDKEVLENRRKFGSNQTDHEPDNHFWQVLKEVITEPLFIILILTASLYFLLGEYQEGFIMLCALTFVAGISLYQENRSRNAISALKKLSAPHAKVIRNSNTLEIPTEEVVMHDLILVEDGNLVPADAQILKANDFSVNESILTGESLAVVKSPQEPDNKILKGTLVVSGSCTARVYAIGKNTELGKISQSLTEIKAEKTPLQLQIRSFVRNMVIFGVMAFLLVWGINFYVSNDLIQSLLRGLTLAMSVLPEEIPVAFSTFMALGAYRLYRDKVITKSPQTVESLGAATVICVDKTGTLTRNEMQLAAIYEFSTDRLSDFTNAPFQFSEVLEYAMWASETEPFDEMEKSLHRVYAETSPEDLRPEFRQSHEYPLEGQPPRMTHVFSNNQGQNIIACKGAVEGVLQQSILTPEQKNKIQLLTEQLAGKGYRVLGVGKANVPFSELPATQFELQFEFLGLVAFYDPPKDNIKETLQQFYQAGIQIKMITGDYAPTALAIASQINMQGIGETLTGAEVLEMPENVLREKVKSMAVFARMFPEAKLKVIQALKANNEVVGMTGDGVNDGPALKAATIGIAMGKRGSEVAKSAASLILADDDLSHMTEAIAIGRRIYENLKKAIQYIISIHIPIILIVTMPLVLLWPFTGIFSPVHVIFLELIMGPTCSIVYENEPIEANSMQKPPRKLTHSFLTFKELGLSMVQGLVIAAACLGIGYYFMQSGALNTTTRTVIFATLIFCNLFLTLVNRSFHYSVFTTIRYKNYLIPLVLSISLGILFLTIYLPFLRTLFGFEPLSVKQLLLCLAVALPATFWVEIWKFYRRKQGL